MHELDNILADNSLVVKRFAETHAKLAKSCDKLKE
jgi:hypothetical protein